jgi:transcriptional regulator with XRE-family HTH domain
MSHNNPNLIALGRAARQLREERGLTHPELASAADLDRGLIEAIEDGRHDPHYDVLLALADGLGVRPSAIVKRIEGPDTDTLASAFGRRLREVRTERGLSQEDLASRTGVHATAIARLERGRREPLLKTIVRVADGLGVPPGTLLDGLARHGERRLTPEEFEEHFGHLPTDGEG